MHACGAHTMCVPLAYSKDEHRTAVPADACIGMLLEVGIEAHPGLKLSAFIFGGHQRALQPIQPLLALPPSTLVALCSCHCD